MSATPQRLGVVVLNWNGRARLGACLDSLVLSDHPDYLVLVVDNGSVDGSADWVRSRGDVELLALPHNLRFAGGNNAGAERAIELGARQLLILNNDTTVAPDTLSQLGAALQEGEVDLVGPRIVYTTNPERIWYGGGIFRSRSGFVGHRAIRKPVSAGLDPAGPTDWVTGCALAIRADLWQELEGLDTGYYIYSEDVDFCLRARAKGARIGYCPDAVVNHEVSATVGGGGSAFKAYHRTRARRQLMRRYGQGGLWPLGLWVQDLAWAGLRLVRGEAAAARAVLSAMSESATAPPRFPVEDLIDD